MKPHRILAAAVLASAVFSAGTAAAQVVSDCRPITSAVPEPGAWTVGAKQFRILWETYERIAKTAEFWPTLVLCESLQPNAAALQAGNRYAVMVMTGLLRLTNGDADELAAVISHEFGHLLHGHGERKQRVHQAARAHAIREGQRSMQGGTDEHAAVLGAVHTYAKSVTAFSRYAEKEADDEGFSLARKAGFSASGLRRLSEKMHQREGSAQRASYLATHPGWGERVKDSSRLELNESFREQAVRHFEAKDAAKLRAVVDEWRRQIPDSGAAAYYDAIHMLMTGSDRARAAARFDEAVGYFHGEGLSSIAQAYQPESTHAPLALCVQLYRQGEKSRALSCLQLLKSEEEVRQFREITGWNAFVFVPAAGADGAGLYASRVVDGAVAITNCKRVASEANLPVVRAWRVPPPPGDNAPAAPQMICSPDMCNCEPASDAENEAIARARAPR
jgi:Zn-dependent protease with chaperone function